MGRACQSASKTQELQNPERSCIRDKKNGQGGQPEIQNVIEVEFD